MRFLVSCAIEAKINLRGPIISERSLCFVKNARDHITMIYFVFAFTSWLKVAFDIIKGNCAQSVVPSHVEELNSFGLLRCPYWSIVTLLEILSLIYWNASVLRVVTAFCSWFWGRPTKSQRKMLLSEEWGCERSVRSCGWWGEGEYFSWPPFQGIGRLFSWPNFSIGCCNSISLREDFGHNCHTTGAPNENILAKYLKYHFLLS